jgi:DNA-binding MarR family transcriptional regulator
MKYNVAMTTQKLKSDTYWLLLQAAIRSKHDFARLAELYDLSAMQLVTLCSLEPARPVPMSRISCSLGCDASNITGIVDRLTSRKLITRTESTVDRRIKTVVLTQKGELLRNAAISEIAATQPASMASLSADESNQLNQLLQKALSSNDQTA